MRALPPELRQGAVPIAGRWTDLTCVGQLLPEGQQQQQQQEGDKARSQPAATMQQPQDSR